MTAGDRPLRVVLAKPGLDGHTRGVQHVARSLREAGLEVIYLGLYQSPERLARVTIQEDADAVGISVLSCADVVGYCRRLRELLDAEGAGEVPILVGGIIRPDEQAALAGLGIDGIFGPGTAMTTILDYLTGRLRADGRAVR